MIILNVAEKPSIAKSISSILNPNYKTTRGTNKYCPNLHFTTTFNNTLSDFIFTSVLGHIYTTDFINKQRWNEFDPINLFDEKITKYIKDDFLSIKQNIEKNTLKASMLIIWTDCDREGENIAMQISTIARNIKLLTVKRARFVGISRREIDYALSNLVDINLLESNAVDARIELDLRIGSAFTRFQTLNLNIPNRVVSYGSCQIPTLGFVVNRDEMIKKFVPEPFFSLQASIFRDNLKNVFKWQRAAIFDKNCVILFHNSISDTKEALIVEVEESLKTKLKPLPLRTVEFQKACSSYYKVSAHKLMEIAEKLYNQGFISYPRTETDSFASNFNFKSILLELEKDQKLSEFAKPLLIKVNLPRKGKNNDMAHSPIYPLKAGNGLESMERNIYEFISRRFLACINENAYGLETKAILVLKNEKFTATGLKITHRNYLKVYFYEKWEESPISKFIMNEKIRNFELGLTESTTTAPIHLSESDLIDLMDKNGIGTDATIHEHINKIQARGYAVKQNNKIIPTDFGFALIKGYDAFGLEFSKPNLRRNFEISLKKIESGDTTKLYVVSEEINLYKDIYIQLKTNIDRFTDVFSNVSPPNDDTKPDPKGKSAVLAGKSFQNSVKVTTETIQRPFREITHSETKNEKYIQKINGESPAIKKFRNIIQCKCRKDSILSIVNKKGENEGKSFYACHFLPRKCNFFVWKEDVNSLMNVSCPRETEIKCLCDYQAQPIISRSANNKGKVYLKCKKVYKPCNFFQWKDD